MQRLSLPLVLSLTAHGLILIAVIFWSVSWSVSQRTYGPLAGGGGGNGVTVEIIGGTGPVGQGGHEVKASPVTENLPLKKATKTKDQMTVKTKTSDKAKAGRSDADGTAVGSPSPMGPGQGSGTPGPGSGIDGINAALAQIRSKIERAKRYPMAARRMNMQGVSLVRFAIAADGQPNALSLKSSSGYPLLDNEALATIKRAAPFPAYGDTLEIGIRFEIDR